jgi:hypothetical protein
MYENEIESAYRDISEGSGVTEVELPREFTPDSLRSHLRAAVHSTGLQAVSDVDDFFNAGM